MEMDIKWMMKSVMMETTTMVMADQHIAILKKIGFVLVETQLIKISVQCVKQCLSQTQIKVNVKSRH